MQPVTVPTGSTTAAAAGVCPPDAWLPLPLPASEDCVVVGCADALLGETDALLRDSEAGAPTELDGVGTAEVVFEDVAGSGTAGAHVGTVGTVNGEDVVVEGGAGWVVPAARVCVTDAG